MNSFSPFFTLSGLLSVLSNRGSDVALQNVDAGSPEPVWTSSLFHVVVSALSIPLIVCFCQFIRPSDFSLKGRRPQFNRRIPWELGPDKKDALGLDVFHKLAIDPLSEATNSSIMSHYVSALGKILTRAETSLTWKSQRTECHCPDYGLRIHRRCC